MLGVQPVQQRGQFPRRRCADQPTRIRQCPPLQRGASEPGWHSGETACQRGLAVADRGLVRVARCGSRSANRALPSDICPDQPASLVSRYPGAHRQATHQQQATTMLDGLVLLDHSRLGRPATVGHRDPYHGPVPGDLYREPAASPAGGMPDRVAAKLGCHGGQVVPRRALGQQGCQPPAHDAKLARVARKHPPPPHAGQ